MIVNCPSCTTRWFVPDEDIPAMGRTVKCASCGHTWFEAAALTLAQPVEGETALRATPLTRADVERMRLSAGKENATQQVRARANARQKHARMRAAALGWAAVGMVFCILFGVATIFRVDLVRLWPQSASAFASVGLGVNPYGLEVRDVKVERTFDGVTPVVTVSGSIANPSQIRRETPNIRLALRDKEGAEVFVWVAAPPAKTVEPGSAVPFTVVLNAPPQNAQSLEASFAPAGETVSLAAAQPTPSTELATSDPYQSMAPTGADPQAPELPMDAPAMAPAADVSGDALPMPAPAMHPAEGTSHPG
jgi:predicted Zn finger-like uncharacterized protein